MKKITLAGTSLVDLIKRIDRYPQKGMLCAIGLVSQSVGGCVPNTGITLKTLAPDKIEVNAIARIGADENGNYIRCILEKHGIDARELRVDPDLPTSFTDVMTVPDGERTFFSAEGANAAFSETDIEIGSLDCSIFHLGYLLLLKTLDEPDAEYGTKAARLLAKIQKRGIKTSIDVVSRDREKFRKTVRPALRYSDYAVVNEIEAEYITGVPLRKGDELIRENLHEACEKMMQAGVRERVVIHCPELGCSLSGNGKFVVVPSLELPKDFIAGAVGAGDAFCAGMLYSFLFDLSEEESLRLASCVAACNLHAADSINGARSLEETWKMEAVFRRKS